MPYGWKNIRFYPSRRRLGCPDGSRRVQTDVASVQKTSFSESTVEFSQSLVTRNNHFKSVCECFGCVCNFGSVWERFGGCL